MPHGVARYDTKRNSSVNRQIMAKKNTTKKKKRTNEKSSGAADMIHFRPGIELGHLIGQLSDQHMVSRGEACKRMVALAIRGFDIGFYGDAVELADFLYSPGNFDESVHHMFVAVQEVLERGQEIMDVPREVKQMAVRQLIDRHSMMRSHEESAQKQRIRIKIQRTND